MFEPHALLGNTVYSPCPLQPIYPLLASCHELSLIKHFSLIVKWKHQHKTYNTFELRKKKHQVSFGWERAHKFISMSCIQLEACGTVEDTKINQILWVFILVCVASCCAALPSHTTVCVYLLICSSWKEFGKIILLISYQQMLNPLNKCKGCLSCCPSDESLA